MLPSGSSNGSSSSSSSRLMHWCLWIGQQRLLNVVTTDLESMVSPVALLCNADLSSLSCELICAAVQVWYPTT